MKQQTQADAEAELAELLEAQVGGEDLTAFIKRISPHRPPPRHLAPLIDLIQRARVKPVRAVVSMPPRHAKTTTIQHGIAWWLEQSPADTHAYTSYNSDQAEDKNKGIRALAVQAGVQLATDAVTKFTTTEGGGVQAAGAGGGLTGQGVSGLLVVDDPIKNPEEANSQVIRDKIWQWFTDVVMTRPEGGSIIVVMTRWHQDDLAGRIIELDEGWEVINLPAIAEADDPLGRPIGEALWQEMYDLDYLLPLKRFMGDYSFSALYQGRPRPRGHMVFGKETYYDPKTFDITGKQISMYADPAATGKTSADYAAIIALAIEHADDPLRMRAWVLEVYRYQVSVPTFMDDLRAFTKRHGGGSASIEAVGGFKAIPDMLEKVDPDAQIEGDDPLGDKFTRAQPVAAAWNDPEGGRVLVPIDNPPWLRPFLKEVQNFTGVNDATDDMVDCLSGAWNSVVPEVKYTRSKVKAKRRM